MSGRGEGGYRSQDFRRVSHRTGTRMRAFNPVATDFVAVPVVQVRQTWRQQLLEAQGASGCSGPV